MPVINSSISEHLQAAGIDRQQVETQGYAVRTRFVDNGVSDGRIDLAMSGFCLGLSRTEKAELVLSSPTAILTGRDADGRQKFFKLDSVTAVVFLGLMDRATAEAYVHTAEHVVATLMSQAKRAEQDAVPDAIKQRLETGEYVAAGNGE